MAVEDLYRPYRPKRRTRATIAKEKGLEPLAALITLQKTKEPLEKAAETYISEEKGVESAKDAISLFTRCIMSLKKPLRSLQDIEFLH